MGLRQVPPGIKDTNLRQFLAELRAAVGGVSDQVTKLVQTRSSSSSGGGGGGGDDGGTAPGTNPPIRPIGDGYPPPPPTSLTATADVWSINLAWSNPVISDYLGTEIWAKRTFPAWSSATRYYVNAKVLYDGVVYRAKQGNDASGTSAVNNTNFTPSSSADWWEATTLTVMADRVKAAEVAGQSYTFTGLTSELLTPGETWAFWVRNHDTEDLYSTYFPNDDVGVSATTLLDPGAMIDLLTGAITDSQLYKDLGARIDLIDVDIPGRQSLVSITTELDNGLSTTNGIVAKKVATFRQGTQPTSTSAYTLVAGDIWVNTADQNKTYRYNGSSWDRIDNTQIDATAASVLNKEEAKIGYCSISPNSYLTKATCTAAGGTWIDQPFATKVTQVGVTASDGTTATVQQQFESVYGPGGLRSQYTLKIDVAGYVSGFGLSTTTNNATPFSEFYIRADRFAIGNPSNTKVSPPPADNIPFIVTTGSSTINGETVDAGVYIKTAYIQNGTITSAKVGDAAITNAKIGGYIASSDFASNGGVVTNPISGPGTAGWCINKNGQAVFNNVRVRGDILLGGGNLIQKSTGGDGTQNTYFFPTGTGATLTTSPIPTGYGSFRMYQSPSTSPGNQYLLHKRVGGAPGINGYPVVPGQTYQASAYTGVVNCSVQIFIDWLDTNGNLVSGGPYGSTNTNKTGGTALNDTLWFRNFVTGVAPVAAAYAQIGFVKSNGVNASLESFADVTTVFFSQTPAAYNYTIPWSPGGISLLDTLALRANAATVVESSAGGFTSLTTNATNGNVQNTAAFQSLAPVVVSEAVKRTVYVSGLFSHNDSTQVNTSNGVATAPGFAALVLYLNGSPVKYFNIPTQLPRWSANARTTVSGSYTYTSTAGASDTLALILQVGNGDTSLYSQDTKWTASKTAQLTQAELVCFTAKR